MDFGNKEVKLLEIISLENNPDAERVCGPELTGGVHLFYVYHLYEPLEVDTNQPEIPKAKATRNG